MILIPGGNFKIPSKQKIDKDDKKKMKNKEKIKTRITSPNTETKRKLKPHKSRDHTTHGEKENKTILKERGGDEGKD